MGPHRGALPLAPATGDKKLRAKKKVDFIREFEMQKMKIGEDIKNKETQMGPHRGAISLGSRHGG